MPPKMTTIDYFALGVLALLAISLLAYFVLYPLEFFIALAILLGILAIGLGIGYGILKTKGVK